MCQQIQHRQEISQCPLARSGQCSYRTSAQLTAGPSRRPISSPAGGPRQRRMMAFGLSDPCSAGRGAVRRPRGARGDLWDRLGDHACSSSRRTRQPPSRTTRARPHRWHLDPGSRLRPAAVRAHPCRTDLPQQLRLRWSWSCPSAATARAGFGRARSLQSLRECPQVKNICIRIAP